VSDETLTQQTVSDTVEETNRAAVVRLIAAWNAGDIGMLAGLWAPSMVHHGREDHPTSAEDTAAGMRRFLAAFPDLKMDLESIVAEGDLVCTRIELRATHLGEFCGSPASGRPVRCRLMGQLRFEDGKVVEHWGVADGIGLLVQIGVLPEHLLAATA
jgi:C-1 hydroxylase